MLCSGSSRYKPDGSKYGNGGKADAGVSKDKKDKYEDKEDNYKGKEDKYEGKEDKYEGKEDKYEDKKDKYEDKEDKYEDKEDKYEGKGNDKGKEDKYEDKEGNNKGKENEDVGSTDPTQTPKDLPSKCFSCTCSRHFDKQVIDIGDFLRRLVHGGFLITCFCFIENSYCLFQCGSDGRIYSNPCVLDCVKKR